MIDWHWGEERPATTAERVGRSVQAVRHRLLARGTSSAMVRGRLTVQGVADATGYTWAQVARAMRGSGVRPIRTSETPRGRRYLLTEEQVDAVVAYLGDETAAATGQSRSVEACAREAGRSLRTAYAWVARLKLQLLPDRAGLSLADAATLVATLRGAPAQPPRDGETVRSVAVLVGCSRALAYRVAKRLGLTTRNDSTLAPGDARVLVDALRARG